MAVSKMLSKGRVTIPKQVRERLGVQPGDLISYEVEGDVVTIKRSEPLDVAFHSAVSVTLDEWTTKEDEEAFRDL